MKRITQFAVLSLLVIGCSQAIRQSVYAQTVQSSQLVAASRTAKVRIHRGQFFSMTQGTETFSAAPAAGWERTPPTQLRKGANIGFGYFSLADPRIPAGYYTLRAFADVKDIGTIDAKIQFIDRRGKVAAEIPAQAEIHSLTVPPGAESKPPIITTAALRANPALPVGRIIVCFCCSNGACICISVFRLQDLMS